MQNYISIGKSPNFFIALCGYKGHSFLSLGVKVDNRVHFLGSFGKKAWAFDSCKPWQILFGLSSWIEDETFIFEKAHEIQYKAFTISFAQYVEFLNYLKVLEEKQNDEKVKQGHNLSWRDYFYAFLPSGNGGLRWARLSEQRSDNDKESEVAEDLPSYSTLHLGNTCRHSSIKLANKVGHHSFGKGLSTFFLKPPPLKAKNNQGLVTEGYFYILPLPPGAFGLSGKEKTIAERLYSRLDEICMSQQDNPLTIEKFKKLKELYEQVTENAELGLFELIKCIFEWEKQNASLIASHRKHHWFTFSTATERMFANFHKEFQSLGTTFSPV
ncbi:Uncharacterised protein (plasmid) [Legionella adelaidensis]|uniref:Uncharacterized protein n=1 Tax=Legionella adelaidensis TaxID=45056 RepID=A0A0W0R1T5_9GAMM|nr:hypothetical protein [Legionella adelaidensis]KTC64921.1 hypothetical protein Lade_1728 [Legionella adelaidensis]VEH85604.1 Uncharacterised protein [Legionella adelaidensis]